MTGFEFQMSVKLVFGAGRIDEAGERVKPFGSKALIVCDPFSLESGLVARLQGSLERSDIQSEVYAKVIPNPTCVLIDEGSEIVKGASCDFVIGLGGGSSIDAAKGIAVAATHEGSIWPYAIGEKEIEDKVLPIVAITTTSGTGSHCTCFSVITNPETNQKPGMGSPHILPSLSIVDPELMLTVPQNLTFNTGFDVLSHAIEAYTSNASSPMSDLFAEKAIKLVASNLPICYEDGQNLAARTEMAFADSCSGIAICHAVVSLAHVMAHVISGHYHDISHGDALATIYREVLRINARALPEKHGFIADALVPGSTDIVSAYEQFMSQFDICNALKAKQPSDDKIRELAEETFTYMKGIVDLNPVEVNVEDAYTILKKSLA